jgi:ATP-binding cassette subfamily B (MDR/TAP) protein 1
VIVMKDGCVEEEGQHDALIRANGVYAELVHAQQFEKRSEASAAPSIMSSSRSTHKEQAPSEDAEASRSVDTAPVLDAPKMSAKRLISRCVALSSQEFPAIIVGLGCSIISGGIIIGEVSLHWAATMDMTC